MTLVYINIKTNTCFSSMCIKIKVSAKSGTQQLLKFLNERIDFSGSHFCFVILN